MILIKLAIRNKQKQRIHLKKLLLNLMKRKQMANKYSHKIIQIKIQNSQKQDKLKVNKPATISYSSN